MTITVGPGFGAFTDRNTSLRAQLIDLVAERDGLLLHGSARPDFFRAEAERRADAEIAAWERAPRDLVDAIDAVLVQMAKNVDECVQHRQRGIEARAAMLAERVEPPSPSVTLQLLDSITGKAVLVTLPRETISFV